MNVNVLMKIMPKYIKCPRCGHDKLGKNNGGLIVGEGRFERTCKCGFRIVINESEEVLVHHYEHNGNTYCGKCNSKVGGGYCDCMAEEARRERK